MKKLKEQQLQKKVAAVTFGRMNPMTTGHMLVCEKLHKVAANSRFLYLSHTQDRPNQKNPLKCKNPLPYNLKYVYVKTFLAESPYKDVQVIKSEARTILDVMKELYQARFTDVIIIVGSDRVEDFEYLINKYNGIENSKTGRVDYKFNSIHVVSAGERVEEGDSLAAMSASKMRKLAVEGNFEEFAKGVPTKNPDLIRDLFKDIRIYMGIA